MKTQQTIGAFGSRRDARERELQRQIEDLNLKLESDALLGWPRQSAVAADVAKAEPANLRAELKGAEDELTCYKQLCDSWEEEHEEADAKLARSELAVAGLRAEQNAAYAQPRTPSFLGSRARSRDDSAPTSGPNSSAHAPSSAEHGLGSPPESGVDLAGTFLSATRGTFDPDRPKTAVHTSLEESTDLTSSAISLRRTKFDGGREQCDLFKSMRFLQPPAFEWMQRIYVKATAASRRSNVRTLQWLQRIETAPSLAELEYLDGRWEDLVTALAEAVMTVAKGPLKRELTP